MGFPVWSRCVSAPARSRRCSATSTCPIDCAGQLIEPGDVIVADDDGVVVVPPGRRGRARGLPAQREDKEERSRVRYAAGELSLDVQRMREALAEQAA